MIIATVTAILILLGGDITPWFSYEVEKLQEGVKEYVADGDNRDEALRITKEMTKLTKKQAKAGSKYAKVSAELLEDPQLDAAELEAELKAFSDVSIGFHEQLADRHIKLRSLISREEWAQIYPPQP